MSIAIFMTLALAGQINQPERPVPLAEEPFALELEIIGSNLSTSVKWNAVLSICKSPQREVGLHQVFSRWGRGSERYDRAILSILMLPKFRCGETYKQAIAMAISARIAEEPALLQQVCWYDRLHAQTARLSSDADAGIDRVCLFAEYVSFAFGAPDHTDYRSGWERYYWLLTLASMLDRPEWIVDMTEERRDFLWEQLYADLLENSPYYRYSDERDCLVFVETAQQMAVPFSAADQQAPQVDTLPPLCLVRSAPSTESERFAYQCEVLEEELDWRLLMSIISSIKGQPNHDAQLTEIIDGWGTKSDAYDCVVLELLQGSEGVARRHVSESMARAAAARIQDAPELLKQVHWYVLWSYQNAAPAGPQRVLTDDSIPPLVQAANDYRKNPPATRAKFYELLFVASAFQRPDWLTHDSGTSFTEENIELLWSEFMTEFTRTAPYYRFDEATFCFLLDEEAEAANTPVPALAQGISEVPSRLPPRSSSP